MPSTGPVIDAELMLAAKRGERDPRGAVVDAHLPLVASYARRYQRAPNTSYSELVQEGVVGVLRAVDRFDPSLGTPFWAYASWWVRQAMQSHVAQIARPVVLSDRAERELARVRRAQSRHLQAYRRSPTSAQLAGATGLPTRQVERLLAVEHTARSLDQPAGPNDSGAALVELLPDPAPADLDDRRVLSLRERRSLRRSARRLTARERKVLRARYGIDCEQHTLRQIADDLAISAERVRQLERQALDKLRQAD
jgi:RNA polymerase primary sigma factor